MYIFFGKVFIILITIANDFVKVVIYIIEHTHDFDHVITVHIIIPIETINACCINYMLLWGAWSYFHLIQHLMQCSDANGYSCDVGCRFAIVPSPLNERGLHILNITP